MTVLLSKDKVKQIGKLACIPINEEEAEKYSSDLSRTLDFIEKVKQIDTKNFGETSNVTGMENIFREDIVQPSLSQDQALSGTNNTHNGFFKVKAVLEDE